MRRIIFLSFCGWYSNSGFCADFKQKTYDFSQIFLDNAGGGDYSMFAFCVNKESRKIQKTAFVCRFIIRHKSLK